MNPLSIKGLPILRSGLCVTMMVLFSPIIGANQIEDAVVSQKDNIAHMHHKLHDDQAPFKAKEVQTLQELNEMTIREDVAITDIYAKIDELMNAKNNIMRLRYEHLIEMRAILTDDQKQGYDQGVLNRSAVK